jgi:glyoxylase-like metal-dependent hydrolase (beta-lactamase superfamily II)
VKTSIAAIALILSVSAAGFAQDQPVTVKTHPVAGNIYMLEGRGGNIGVSAGEDGILIVDTQFDNMAGPITDALNALNKGKLRFIVNTHFHGDHTGGNKALGQGVPIVAHENVRTRMIGDRDLSEAAFRNSLPMVTYEDGASMHFNGEEITLAHLQPGHTDTDTLVHFTGSNVYHTGDQFTNGMYPFIDLAGGGDVEGYLKNVAHLVEVIPDNAKIIPGHGPLATKKDLLAFQQVLTETVDIVRKGIAAGKDQEALQKEGLPEKYKAWGGGPGAFVGEQRWISMVFQGLSR